MGRSKHSGGSWPIPGQVKAIVRAAGEILAEGKKAGAKKKEAESKEKTGEWKTQPGSAYNIRERNIEMAEKIKKETGY